jgi:sec-independent protein translocase protein TatA
MYLHVYTFVGIPGGPELLVVLLLVVLLFGADRLPRLARSSGQAMGEFKKGREAVEAEIRAARDETLGGGDETDDVESAATDEGETDEGETESDPGTARLA